MTEQDRRLPTGIFNKKSTYVLGCDFAKTSDETALVIVEQLPFSKDNDDLFVMHMETHQIPLNQVIGRIKYLDSKFEFKKIICDKTGMGEGPVDILKQDLGGKIEGIAFTRSSKPDMFNNLKLLLQQKKLCIPSYKTNSDDKFKKLFFQFLAITAEYSSRSEVPHISHEKGTHDDLVCALALACLHFRVGKNNKRQYPLTGR